MLELEAATLAATQRLGGPVAIVRRRGRDGRRVPVRQHRPRAHRLAERIESFAGGRARRSTTHRRRARRARRVRRDVERVDRARSGVALRRHRPPPRTGARRARPRRLADRRRRDVRRRLDDWSASPPSRCCWRPTRASSPTAGSYRSDVELAPALELLLRDRDNPGGASRASSALAEHVADVDWTTGTTAVSELVAMVDATSTVDELASGACVPRASSVAGDVGARSPADGRRRRWFATPRQADADACPASRPRLTCDDAETTLPCLAPDDVRVLAADDRRLHARLPDAPPDAAADRRARRRRRRAGAGRACRAHRRVRQPGAPARHPPPARRADACAATSRSRCGRCDARRRSGPAVGGRGCATVARAARRARPSTCGRSPAAFRCRRRCRSVRPRWATSPPGVHTAADRSSRRRGRCARTIHEQFEYDPRSPRCRRHWPRCSRRGAACARTSPTSPSAPAHVRARRRATSAATSRRSRDRSTRRRRRRVARVVLGVGAGGRLGRLRPDERPPARRRPRHAWPGDATTATCAGPRRRHRPAGDATADRRRRRRPPVGSNASLASSPVRSSP